MAISAIPKSDGGKVDVFSQHFPGSLRAEHNGRELYGSVVTGALLVVEKHCNYTCDLSHSVGVSIKEHLACVFDIAHRVVQAGRFVPLFFVLGRQVACALFGQEFLFQCRLGPGFVLEV